MYGYGNSTNYSLRDYAPVDPLSGLPGFGAEEVSPQNVSQQGQQPGTSSQHAARSTQPGPSTSGSSINRSQSESERHQAKQQHGMRQLTTEELRRDFERAPQYIPTPINEPSTNPSSSAHQPNRQQAQVTSRNADQASSNHVQLVQQQQQLQQQQLQQQRQQKSQNKRGQSNVETRRKESIQQNVQMQRKNAQTTANSGQSSTQRPPQNRQSVQNFSYNGPLPSMQRMVPPIPVPPGSFPPGIQVPPTAGMARPPDAIQIIHQNPEIGVFSTHLPQWNTHIFFNKTMVTVADFAAFVRKQSIGLGERALLIIRSRLSPNDVDYITLEECDRRLRIMDMQPNAMQSPQGFSPVGQIPGGNNAAPRAPPNVQNSRVLSQSMPPQMRQQHPQGIPQMIPPGMPLQVPPQFIQQQQQMQGQMTREQFEQHQHMQRLFAIQQQMQNARPPHQMQPQQPPPQFQPPQQHQPQQQRPPNREEPRQTSRSRPTQSSQHPMSTNQQSQLQPANIFQAPQEGGSNPSTRMDIAADESPPPCSYTPPHDDTSFDEPSEAVDVKPVVPVPEKQNKNKKKIVTITLDDDDAPRKVTVKQEVPDEEVSSSSEAVSSAPSTSSAPIDRSNIKKEHVNDASKERDSATKEKTDQEKQQSKKVSVKSEPVEDESSLVQKLIAEVAQIRKQLADVGEAKDKDERKTIELAEAMAKRMLPSMAAEMANKLYEERVAREGIQKASEPSTQQTTLQESQVSTSAAAEAASSIPPASPTSSESDILPMRRKNRVVEDSDDSWEQEEEQPRQDVRSQSAAKNNLREKKRRVVLNDSDDEMPVVQRKRKPRQYSTDDEMNDEDWNPAYDSERNSDMDDFFLHTDDEEEDDFENFIVDDDETIESDEYDELEEAEKKLKMIQRDRRTRNSQRRSITPPRRTRSSPPRQSTVKPKRIERVVDDHKRSSEPGPSSSVRPMTEEEKKKAKRQKICRTREANRERARVARLEAMSQIEPYTRISKRDSQDSQRNETRKEKPSSINKRSIPSISDDNDDEGVHIPAKRMAHSNSVPNPSRNRPVTSAPRITRPSHNETFEKRAKEAEERKKQFQIEYDKLKIKKFPTGEEQIRITKLRSLLGIAPTSSTPSTSSSFNKVKIKKEIVEAPVNKEIPPPKLLDPHKGKGFLKYRNHFINKIFRILLDENVPNAAEQAQKIELGIVESHPKSDKYHMAGTHKIRNLLKECTSVVLEVNKNAVSHEQILAGGTKENCTVGNGRKTQVQHRLLSMEQLHPLLVPLKMSESDLEKEAYPLFKKSPRFVTIAETQYTKNKKIFLADKDMTRTCSRCNKEFSLKPDGSMVREKDICRYHNRGVAKEGKRDTFRKRYPCCNEEYNVAPGCKFSDVHVFDQLFERELGKFVATPPPTEMDPRTLKAYAIDCEMVYTVSGPALARLTMVDMKGNMVLDIFIKPPTEVLDPNTEFSGLTMEQIENAKDTMQTCHQKLFKLVNSETILIGHSLESDLKAMRIVHKSVIDTAILFRSSGDFKIALKNLSSKLLRKTIQGDNEDAFGHDSLEDARTCVDLIYYGLKNPESLVIR